MANVDDCLTIYIITANKFSITSVYILSHYNNQSLNYTRSIYVHFKTFRVYFRFAILFVKY